MTGAALRMLGALCLVAASPACSGRAAEYDGIGNWRFPHTTLKDITGGLCQPTDLSDGRKATWCFAQQPIKVGERTAEVDLYFLGTEPTARLIEIQLKVRGCREDELDHWMRQAFGPPIDSRPTRGYWKNSFLWAAALMPSEPGRCLVHLLPVSENAEIDRIKQL
ncbi:MAG TPA: hypothetical protein VIX73_03000 [Kofleriaceae bacterium]